MATTPPITLTFAGSDPSGGAGLQADLMTFASMGCHGLSVVTAITVQDTIGIESILPIDAEWVSDQARQLLEDMPIAAFKIGMVGSVENIATIAGIVADYPDIPLVVDPVLSSGRGDEMGNEDITQALLDLLIPQATLITPNSIEARRLTADEQDGELTLQSCAIQLLNTGCEYVLITGTHENTPEVTNILYGHNGIIRQDSWKRLPGSYHGSGCTLASAITALLAHGAPIETAIKDAQDYTWESLSAGFRPGMGQFLPDRFFWAQDINDEPDDKA
ncbi:MAG: hydroxymethylpyrimidine/phosphomethylpyrimidine kinase [Proteobacteria bacterium]|nr:hydroxymethylpyrimidine/phosphomethylpyrimidine kinase [Pseudomonadota bacterium]MDE3207370.1 hydroxymethylpyrimidine/phosphomethylpyrimidine kinase [Pseudomonadota bacterium]